MNKEIKELEKKIKKADRAEKFFDKLSYKMTKVKFVAVLGVSALILATIFMPTAYYIAFASIGLVLGIDFIVEGLNNYGAKASYKQSLKQKQKKEEFVKMKAECERKNINVVSNEEIMEIQKAFGIDSSVSIEKSSVKNHLDVEREKE